MRVTFPRDFFTFQMDRSELESKSDIVTRLPVPKKSLSSVPQGKVFDKIDWVGTGTIPYFFESKRVCKDFTLQVFSPNYLIYLLSSIRQGSGSEPILPDPESFHRIRIQFCYFVKLYFQVKSLPYTIELF